MTMTLQESSRILAAKEERERLEFEAGEIARAQMAKDEQERREAEVAKKKAGDIAECESVVAFLTAAIEAVALVKPARGSVADALVRCGAAASGEGGWMLPATMEVPQLLEKGLTAARERLARLTA